MRRVRIATFFVVGTLSLLSVSVCLSDIPRFTSTFSGARGSDPEGESVWSYRRQTVSKCTLHVRVCALRHVLGTHSLILCGFCVVALYC